MIAALLLLSPLLTVDGAFDVAVSVRGAHATTCVSSLTSVTMDVCIAKQRFPFSNPDLLALATHLGGGDSILRIGGSDQNNFYYDMNSTATDTFSAKTGGQCCTARDSCHSCASDCTMPAAYWTSIANFARASRHRLMFGLVPDVDQATRLISFSADPNAAGPVDIGTS